MTCRIHHKPTLAASQDATQDEVAPTQAEAAARRWAGPSSVIPEPW